MVLHFPALRHSHKTREQEMDFIIGQNYIITTHYDLIDPLHKFAKLFDAQAILTAPHDVEHAGLIAITLIKKLYKAIEHEVESIRRDLTNIEEHIFSHEHIEMVSAISRTSRDLLNLRHTIEPHRDVLQSLETVLPETLGTDLQKAFKLVTNEYYRVHNHIMREIESLRELRETNNSLLTTKQNETMRVFTILAFITFPLGLVLQILGIRSDDNPFTHLPHDFWWTVGILSLISFCMLLYFKKKHWL
jgi:magnesium transporter